MYEYILKDKEKLGQIKWQMLMVDKVHRLRGGESQLYEALSGFFPSFKMLITGTPLQNNIKGTYASTQATQPVLTLSHYLELLALMHILMPDRFLLNADFELSNINQEVKIKELHDKLRNYVKASQMRRD